MVFETMTSITMDRVETARDVAAGLASVSSKAGYGAAAGTVLFGLNVEVWGVIAGILIGVITLTVNIYYQKRKHKLDILLAKSQLDAVAHAVVDNNKQAMADDIRAEFEREFGHVSRRGGEDRRKNTDPNYNGVERRSGNCRRTSLTGDTDTARLLRTMMIVSKEKALGDGDTTNAD
jgi:hypothetical protein